MLNCQKADKASLLSEAVSRLNLLTQKCHSLETQLATMKGESPPPPLPPPAADDDDDDDDGADRSGQMCIDSTEYSARASSTADVAEQAVQGERQLQLWAQLGESALHDLLLKLQNSAWEHMHTRDGINGFLAQVATPGADGSGAQRLDYCVKAETTLPLDPETVAAAYLNVSDRHKWHANCTESRLVEELWPGTMCIAYFTYRTELPVYPRGYCSLVHRANHQMADDRVQIVIVDRSVSHPSVQQNRNTIFLEVFPSGMVITPIDREGETHSQIQLLAHFDLKGTISSQLFERIQANRMLEMCCFKYLNEFCKFLTDEGSSPAVHAAAHAKAGAMPESDLATEGAATLIYAANSVAP